ncbi:MAG: hypothetical protein EU531_01820 [Promethearchaeota archaeon]|nr:MAG: hypothetical protein EU531_01820 [Candidatus Lokiarchaeota archaeon]
MPGAAGAPPGGLGVPPAGGAAGGPGRLAKVGAFTTPEPGACGGAPPGLLVPGAGGSFGAGGRPPLLGGPPVGACGGPPLTGALGGPAVGGLGKLDAEEAVGEADAVVVAAEVPVPALPLNKLKSVLAAAVFAVVGAAGLAIFFEDVLTVVTSGSTATSFKSFNALFKDFIKSFIPLTVSSRSSDNEVNPFFIKLMTRSSFFCSLDTNIYSIPLVFTKVE